MNANHLDVDGEITVSIKITKYPWREIFSSFCKHQTNNKSHDVGKARKEIESAGFPGNNPISNQKGSIIVLALMVLVIMTVIGLISSDTIVTEKFIQRNQAIYKQNINMVDAAIMEGLQRFMQLPHDDQALVDLEDDTTDWFYDKDNTWVSTWYTRNSAARVLDTASALNITTLDTTTPRDLVNRGEDGSGNLLVGFIGWNVPTFPGGGSESLVTGAKQPPAIKDGRIVGEYVSLDASNANNGFGILRMEIGVRRLLSTM